MSQQLVFFTEFSFFTGLDFVIEIGFITESGFDRELDIVTQSGFHGTHFRYVLTMKLENPGKIDFLFCFKLLILY